MWQDGGNRHYSIICDYLGTPHQMYNQDGELTWDVEYDIYGKIRTLHTGSLNDCPFRYQGQYFDPEVDLYYNRFRYYDCESGVYISRDPIGLAGGMHNIYAYVHDSNFWIDAFGLNVISGAVLAGNTSGPSSLRTPQDVVPDSSGIIKGQSASNKSLSGKSAFNNADNMSEVLKGTKVHEITSSSLPEGLAMKADGIDVGGTRAKGHITIFNTRDMTFDEFKGKVDEIETKKIGSINKMGKYTCG